MSIKRYQTQEEYNSGRNNISESLASLVVPDNNPRIDGVNVRTMEPVPWDVVYADENNEIVIIRRETYKPLLLPSSWKYIGPAYERVGQDKVRVLWGNAFSTPKYADVVQFKVTVPSESGTISLGAQFVSAGTTTTITVEYTAEMDLATEEETYEENDTTLCGRINTALAALTGITGTWWAYLNADGDVILQRDTWTDYRQYTCSGALTFVTWGDMPSTSATVLKVDGKTTTYRGVMNVSGAVTYWSTNGRTPTAQVPAHLSGNDDPVNKTAFDSNAYCDLLRAEYGDYATYIEKCFSIHWPQRFGVFSSTFDAAVLTKTYGNLTAPTKDGTGKYKFPALHWALTVGHVGVKGCEPGDLNLWGADDGLTLFSDEGLRGLNSVQSKAGKTTLANSSHRWFAQRYPVNNAWLFYGYTRMLHLYYVHGTFQAGAVTLLKFR
ncbi:MAG: hypothetical protein IKN32_00875 [Bacteroidales bacterium]|nr:hypothetical protein [Bacteroidales bacterium]